MNYSDLNTEQQAAVSTDSFNASSNAHSYNEPLAQVDAWVEVDERVQQGLAGLGWLRLVF